MNFSRILKAGLLVGTLDITAACLQYYIKTGKGPGGVLKFVASGVFGKSAFTDGWIMNLYGLLFHYFNAFAFTIFFFWVYPRLKFLAKNWVLTGIGYGIFTWAVMNLIVVPLSNTPKITRTVSGSLIAMSILIICIGLPLAFMNRSKKSISS